MSGDDLELVPGTGNVFRDIGHPNADLEQAKAILAARIIGIMDDQRLTARALEQMTGIAHSDFSRIRNAKLDRFTLDRLFVIVGKLDHEAEISIDIKRRLDARATATMA